ncbi:hypothetical protein F5890DRAFT_1472904, partial [Lentinula detonsa]
MTTTQAAPLDGRGRALDQHEHSSRAPNSDSLGPRQPSHMPLVISTTSLLVSRTWGVTLKSLLDNGAIMPFKDVLVDSDKKVFGQPRDDLIAKFFREAKSEKYGEVKALRMMNLLVESGKTMDPHPKRQSSLLPVIIMKKKEGITCRQYIKDYSKNRKDPSHPRGPRLNLERARKIMCKQASDVPARLWLGSPGFGLEALGFGLEKTKPGP